MKRHFLVDVYLYRDGTEVMEYTPDSGLEEGNFTIQETPVGSSVNPFLSSVTSSLGYQCHLPGIKWSWWADCH